MHFTPLRDDACFRGTYRSVCSDAFPTFDLKDPTNPAGAFMSDIDSRTNGTVTALDGVFPIESLHQLFKTVEREVIKPDEDFSAILGKALDNTSSFGVLHWEGDQNNQCCHTTRVKSIDDREHITLLDTTLENGVVKQHKLTDLRNCSPKGFTFFWLSTKTEESEIKAPIIPKTEPEIEDLGRFLSAFNKESDRGAALIAASMLDQRLSEILRIFFVSSETSEELLSGFNAPLGTFAARASAAYSLGLIQQNEFNEITIIRKIRNEYGHVWQPVSFEKGRVSDLCRHLPWEGPTEYEENSTMRSRFNFAVCILLTDLLWRVRLVREERREERVWPNKSRI